MNIRLDFNKKSAAAWQAKGLFGKDESSVAGKVISIGLGKKEKHTLEKARRAAAKAVSQAKGFQAETLSVDMGSFMGELSLEDLTSAFAEGIRLSGYRFEKYKSKPAPKTTLKEVTLFFKTKDTAEVSAIRKAFREAEIISDAVYFTRDLANEPANVMTPPVLAAAAKEMAKKAGLVCRVLGKEEMKKLGMGGILGVSQGSGFPPQLIILENKSDAKDEKPVVLVGKGITFDTGGISIKPSADMDKMKFDMCGAACVIGAMKAAADLKLKIKVIGLIPVCENMPGSKAQRPGDIVRISNGKTVEVLNTDAEGRLILADALSYAKHFSPRAIVDIATLTGACAATFSDLASGVMGTDPELIAKIREAGEKTGERCWELPLWDEYGELIRATYADIQNISKRNAGTITAGMFLKEFAEHTKSWAHLDIAGTAWNSASPKPLSPIGATGVGVRLFVELLKNL